MGQTVSPKIGVASYTTLPYQLTTEYRVYIPDVKWTVRSAVYNLKL
jgi:hypothetical protein